MTEEQRQAAIRALQMMGHDPQVQQMQQSETPTPMPEVQDGNMLDKREAEPENLSMLKALMFNRDPKALLRKKDDEEDDQ